LAIGWQVEKSWVPLENIQPVDDRGSMLQVLNLADLDGDGYSEFAASQLGTVGGSWKPGVVDVFDGLDRTRNFRFRPDQSHSAKYAFGSELSRGRVLGLGRNALLIGDPEGSPNNDLAGHVAIVDPLLGTELGSIHGGPSDKLGTYLKSGVDLDGDGNDEILVGAPNAPTSASGAPRLGVVYLLDGATLAERFRWEGTTSGEGFHGPFDFLDDLDGDGISEILVASPHFDSPAGGNAGMVMIASGATGQVIWSQSGTYAIENYGWRATNLADLTGDGRAEFGWLIDGGARLVIYDGIPGSPIFDIDVSKLVINPFDIEAIGDRDDDGTLDLAVPGLLPPGVGPGRIPVYSGATGNLIEIIDPPRSATFNSAFGVSIAELDDVTGDGQADFAAIGMGGLSNDGEVLLWQEQSIYADPRGIPRVHLRAPGHAFGQFALYFSDSIGDGTPLGSRTIPLDWSPLYVWSIGHPVFGWLDGKGQASIRYELPPEGLIQDGDRVFAAWLGLDSSAPNGVKVISNPIVVPMQ
jgi:hypothetical protein